MKKESSLITATKTIKRLLIILIIITILVVCWNTFKGFPSIKPPISPNTNRYQYFQTKSLAENFVPAAIETEESVSLYSKEVLLKGQLPNLPEYAYIYQVTIPKEDFGTFSYANTVADKFGFSSQDMTFEQNELVWENENGSIEFDRSDLSFLYMNYGTNQEEKKQPKLESINDLISTYGLNLSGFNLNSPEQQINNQNKVYVFSKAINYIPMSETELKEYLSENKVQKTAELVNLENKIGYFFVEVKDKEELTLSDLLSLYYRNINIKDNEEDDTGIYKLIDINEAFQEINTFKILDRNTDQQEIQDSNFITIYAYNQNSFFETLSTSDISTLTIDAEKTKIGYIVASSNGIDYLHPIYIFEGSGINQNEISYAFRIFVDALPKK